MPRDGRRGNIMSMVVKYWLRILHTPMENGDSLTSASIKGGQFLGQLSEG
jgi:hypothetical protein